MWCQAAVWLGQMQWSSMIREGVSKEALASQAARAHRAYACPDSPGGAQYF